MGIITEINERDKLEPKKDENDLLLWGFQLWANLPASHKMMEPRYRDIKKDEIPEIDFDDGVKVKIICGVLNGIKGPVQDIITEPEYLDVSIRPNSEFSHPVREGNNVIAYIIEGEAYFDEDSENLVGAENLVIYKDGDQVLIRTTNKNVRFLLISGKPLRESVAWQGPIVMNTEEELRIAFEEYRNGTFIKHGKEVYT